MKKLIVLVLLVFLAHLVVAEEIVTLRDGRQIVVYDDFTWGYLSTDPAGQSDYSNIRDNEIPSFLRQGGQATRDQIIQAIRMHDQGLGLHHAPPKE